MNGYTRMLSVENVHLSDIVCQTHNWMKIPPLSDKIGSSRPQITGHCFQHPLNLALTILSSENQSMVIADKEDPNITNIRRHPQNALEEIQGHPTQQNW